MSAAKWTFTDRLNRPANLGDGDYCYYYLVYKPNAGFGYSQSNQDILNYKIPIGTDKVCGNDQPGADTKWRQ